MNKQCPRCQKTFACQADNISQCQCTQTVVSPTLSNHLQATYTDCLCISCLQALGESLKSDTFTPPKEQK